MTPAATPVRIVIADDHPIFRDGLRRLLESEPDFTVIAEAADPQETVAHVRAYSPDVLLLDLLMPRGGGLTALRELSAAPHPVRIVLLTAAIEPSEQLLAIELGVRGIVMKESATDLLLKCIRHVMAGGCWLGRESVASLVETLAHRPARRAQAVHLTDREMDVVAAVVDGASNRDIAEQFGLSQQTVKNHLSNIFDKLGVSTRLELALYALNHQLLAPRRASE